MGAFKQEFINNAIDAHRPADQFQLDVVWVAEDEMVGVKPGQVGPTNSTSQSRDVVHIGFGHHGGHGLLDAAVAELIVGVLIPDLLEIEVRSIEKRLEEGQAACVGD